MKEVSVVVRTMGGSFAPPENDRQEMVFLVRFEGYDLGEGDQPDPSVLTAATIVLSLEGVASLIVNLSVNASDAGLGTALQEQLFAEYLRERQS